MEKPPAASARDTSTFDIFFITDRIKARELRVEHCPSKDLIADFFTKPLQGQLFHKPRALILNLPDDDPSLEQGSDHRSVLEDENP